MKVLIIASSGPALLNFRGRLIADMIAGGHSVSIIAPEMDKDVASELDGLGADLHDIRLKRNRVNPLSDIFYMVSLLKIMRRTKPDLVFSSTIKPNIWGSIAARLSGIESVAMVTGLGYVFIDGKPSLAGKGFKAVARWLYAIATRFNRVVIFQNPDDRDDFIAAGCLGDASRVALVNGSGVDLDHFDRAVPVLAPVFLMVARLLVSKGVLEYVEAARQLRRKYPAARCLLVGPQDGGPDAVDPEEIERWKLGDAVEYVGPVADIRPIMSQSAVFVLPSYREGTPRSGLEAMAMGRPIITTDAPGCRETVEEGVSGFLVPVKDSQSLAEAMSRFIEQPSLIQQMGERSRELAEERFDVRKVNADMLRIMGLG